MYIYIYIYVASILRGNQTFEVAAVSGCVAVRCNVLQCSAVCCSFCLVHQCGEVKKEGCFAKECMHSDHTLQAIDTLLCLQHSTVCVRVYVCVCVRVCEYI